MIELREVTKRFGGFLAVDRLTIGVQPGELYVLLGPNGAGKTTTIKMLTGLYKPTSGSITVDSLDVIARPTEAKGRIGYIPDQAFLYEKLTGREYLHFSAGLFRVAHDEARERITELASVFEVGEWIDRRTEHYSQGMRQRIAIVAALLHRPKALVIDEPMVGLDPKSAHIVKKVLRQEAKSGAAILMSTHSLPVAEELGDKIGIVHGGRLVFEGDRAACHARTCEQGGTLESLFLEMTA